MGPTVCVYPPFSTLTNLFNSITTHDQFVYGIHPPLHIPSTPLSPCHHRRPVCVVAPNELPLISQTIHTLPNPTLFTNSAQPISIGGQWPAILHIVQTAPIVGVPPPSILKTRFANSAPHIVSCSTPTPNLPSPPILQTAPIAGVPPTLCSPIRLCFTCPPYRLTLDALVPTPTHLFTAPCAPSHPFAQLPHPFRHQRRPWCFVCLTCAL